MNLCARCGTDYLTVTQFDAHPCMTASMNPDATAVLREKRRTSVITMTSATARDVIRLCDPGCRDEFLLDLGLKGSGGGSAFPSRGEADVHVAWNGSDYRVTWKRCAPSALPCDLCGPQWRYRAGRERSSPAPTAAQLRSRADFASRVRAEARNRENPAA